MMPFIDLGPFDIFGLKIHLFGILVASGVVAGSWVGAKYAEKSEIDVDWLRWAAFRVIVVGFIICHFIDVLFYQPDKLAEDPLLLLKVWQGISSYGGFIGGLIGFLWFTRKTYEPPVSRLELGDCFVFGFAPGFWFGRLACTTAHDHAGMATDFMFGVEYPKGAHKLANGVAGTYHDLGLYEAIFLMPAIMIGLLLLVQLKSRKPGLLIAFTTMVYAVPRFFLEYLRFPESDPRYWGLTPAQYFSIAMFAAGAYLLVMVMPKQPKTTRALTQDRRDAAKSKRKSIAKGEPAERGVARASAKVTSAKSSTKPAASKPKSKPKPKVKSSQKGKKRKKK